MSPANQSAPHLNSNHSTQPDESLPRNTTAWIFLALVAACLISPLLPEQVLRYGGSDTDKAFFFRSLVELAFPFYLYLILRIPAARPNLKQPLTLCILGFLLVFVITTVTGVDAALSFWGNLEHMGGVYQLIHLILLYFYVLLIMKLGATWQKWFLRLFLVPPSVVALNGIFEKLGWPTLPHNPVLSTRISSTLYNPDYLGAYLVIPLFIAIYLSFQAGRTAHRIIYGSVAVLMAVALYLSGTRGSVAGLFAGALGAAVIYVILTKHRRIRRAGIAVIGAGLVAVGIMFAISSHLPADSLIHRLFIWDDADAKSRILNWGIAVKGYPHNPIFGVGPENYYFISNKYYNPAIYAYDPSYLARPHNYFLELLVTTGPLGLLAYLTVACLAIWALCRAYRSGRLNLIGMAVLAGALVAYQTQNLTLFDTVSGGIVFFTLLGIAGHIRTAPSNDVQRDHKALSVTRPALGKLRWVVAVGAATAAGAIYFTNVLPLRAAVDTAKAEAVASTDPFQAADNYDQAVNTPFNFDQTDLALSLADFAGGLAENATDVTQKQLAQQELDRSINLSAQVADHNPTSARNWIDLANDYVAQFIGFGGTLNGAQPALDHAIDLEPERPEPGLLQADVFALKNRLPEAESVLQNLAANFPTIERVNQRLAYVLQGEGKTADGVSWFEKAVRLGYVPPNYASIKWVGDYYAGQGQYSKEVALYGKTLTTTDPNDIDLAVALVNAYQKNGQRDAAFALYQKIIAIDPNRAKDMPHVAPAGA